MSVFICSSLGLHLNVTPKGAYFFSSEKVQTSMWKIQVYHDKKKVTLQSVHGIYLSMGDDGMLSQVSIPTEKEMFTIVPLTGEKVGLMNGGKFICADPKSLGFEASSLHFFSSILTPIISSKNSTTAPGLQVGRWRLLANL